jgi:hypothetical protein
VLLAAGLIALAVGPAHAAYEVAAVADAGTLTGVVRFTGRPPRAAPGVPKPGDVCGDRPASEALVVGAEGGVRGSVVRVERVRAGKPGAGELLLDSVRCAFVSHVSVAAAGDRLRVRNSDGTLHAARGVSGRRTVFSVALPHRGQVVDVTRSLATPGVIRVLCEAHPHMLGWIVVHDSPYVAVTDERGSFRIDGVPPGTYTVRMWHEGFRSQGVDAEGRPRVEEPHTTSRDITIAPRAVATVEFELK